MRHDIYVDTYRRYKRGTARIAQWLAVAGRLCGAEVEQKTNTDGKYLMPLSKFRELANAIAECTEPRIQVRPELLDLLRDVISLRLAACLFFRNNSSSDELFERSNEGHLHTIEVLQDVLTTLIPLGSAESQPRAANLDSNVADHAEIRSNIFDTLDLEDIAEPVVQQELTKANKNRNSRGRSFKRGKVKRNDVELGSSKDELIFNLFCFFKDLHDIQAYLGNLWQQHKDGDVPLTTAAVTTDLAFDFIKNNENQMLASEWVDETDGTRRTMREVLASMQKNRTSSAVPLYWNFEKEGGLLNHGYLGELVFSHVSDFNGDKLANGKASDEAVQTRMYQVSEWLYTPAYIMLDRLEASSTGADSLRGAPQNSSASFTRTNGEAAVIAASEFEKRFETLGKLGLDLVQIYCTGLHEALASDIWTKTFAELMSPLKPETKKRLGPRNNRQLCNTIPVWLAFATTVYLDVRTLLGSQTREAFQDLEQESKMISRTITQMLQWAKHHPEPAWTQSHVAAMVSLQRAITIRGKLLPKSPPHHLMRTHPLLAGIRMFFLQLCMWDASIGMTNIHDGIGQATHLYGLASTKTPGIWKDMEYLLGLHDEEYLYYGGRPKNISESCRKYSLALGMSAQTSANHTHSARKISARGFQHAVRQLRPHVIPSDLLNHRYEAIRMRSGPAEGPQTNLPASELLLEFQKRQPNATLDVEQGQSAHVVPLLCIVQKALSADTKHLAFDYVAMHQRCWAVLERLQMELREDLAWLGGHTGQNLMRKDQMSLRIMVGVIFNSISAVSKSGLNKKNDNFARLALNTIDIVQSIAEEESCTGLDAVKDRLSSRSLQRPRTDDGINGAEPDVNSDDLAMLNAALDMAPERSLTEEQVKEVLKRASTTPLDEFPPHTQEYLKHIQASGGDLSKGVQGVLQGIENKTSQYTPEQQERVLQTTTMKELLDLMKVFERQAVEEVTSIDGAEEKKKRNNKNKNKNRKLKQKEMKAAAATGSTLVSTRAQDEEVEEVVRQKPLSVNRKNMTPGQIAEQDWEAYEQARKEGKMIIDGEEFVYTGRKTVDLSLEDILNPENLTEEQCHALMQLQESLAREESQGKRQSRHRRA
ncbi:unnamed protein product [Cercospora beticola]|nr:unnamed protein product [Cercospora beticola]